MKHVYYGVKQQKITVDWEHGLDNIDLHLENYDENSWYYENRKYDLEQYIKLLKEKSHSIGYILNVKNISVDNKVVLYQTFSNQHTSEVDEWVEFNFNNIGAIDDGKVTAKITSRYYDPIENTMYYHTGAVMEELPFDEEDYESKRVKLLEKAEEIYNKHFPNIKQFLEDEKENIEEVKKDLSENKGLLGKFLKKLLG